jgi:hypothetical protein
MLFEHRNLSFRQGRFVNQLGVRLGGTLPPSTWGLNHYNGAEGKQAAVL